MKCVGIPMDHIHKTEEEHRPDYYFKRNPRTKQKGFHINLKRAALAEQFMQKKPNIEMDGHKLKLTLIDTKTILKLDHRSVRISNLSPNISVEQVVDILTRDVGGISVGKDGKPEVELLFRFEKQSFMKITFDSPELADKCVARTGQPLSEDFGKLVKIRLFEITEKVEPVYKCIICSETYDRKDVKICVQVTRGKGNAERHSTCKYCVAGYVKVACLRGVLAEGGVGIPCGFPGCRRAFLRAHLMRMLELDDDTKMQLEKLMDKKVPVNIKDGVEL